MSRRTATTVATLVTCALIGTLPVACDSDMPAGLTPRTWPAPPPEPGQQAPAGPGAAGPSGPSAPTSGQAQPLPFNLDSSRGVAVDTKGTVYVTDGTQVLTLPAGSNTVAGFKVPDVKGLDGLAVDGKGTIYVVDRSGQKVLRIAGREATDVSSGLKQPTAVAADASGNVYVADNDTHKLFKLSPDGNSLSDLQFPIPVESVGLAVDKTGTVYVADKGAKQLWKWSPGGDNPQPPSRFCSPPAPIIRRTRPPP